MLLYGFSRFNADSDAIKNVELFIQLAPKALELSKWVISEVC